MQMDPEVAAAALTAFTEIFVKPTIEKSQQLMGRAKDEFDYSRAAKAYHKRLIELYSKQRMLGKPDEVTITDLFTDVYVLDKQTALRRFDIATLREEGELRSMGRPGERKRGFPLVAEGDNLYILGKPGAGKTTFLKYIVTQAAVANLRKLPIFVSLNEWSNSQYGQSGQEALLPFIVEQFAICRFPDAKPFIEKLLESGDALLLFDGLDEVRQEGEQRRTLRRLLQNFAKQYSDCQCLITCRIAASDVMFEGFRDVEVADFTPEQVEIYAEKWFTEFPHKLDLFKAEIAKTENEGLAELCCSPLLLAMLCLYFNDVQAFPTRRAELYEEAIEALLKKWDSNRDIQRDYFALSARRKQQMFAWIAAQTFEENDYFVEQRRLVSLIEAYLARLPDMPADIDGQAILKAIEAQHGIFVERAKGIYSFAHLTFQEYFAARYIVENEARGTTKSLTQKHLGDDRWREVFLLTASMLDDGEDFVNQMRKQVDVDLAKEPALIALLTWADEKTQNAIVRDESQQAAIRLAYIYLDLASARSLDLESARESARALALALARDRARALALDLALARDLARALARALARDLALVKTLNADVGVDFGLLYTWQYASIYGILDKENRVRYVQYMDEYSASFFPQVIDLVREQVDATRLCDRLAALVLPTGQDDGVAWRKFVDALAQILNEERDFDFTRKISYQQLSILNTYFNANERLLRCLELATVSDRAGIKARLLLPPEG